MELIMTVGKLVNLNGHYRKSLHLFCLIVWWGWILCLTGELSLAWYCKAGHVIFLLGSINWTCQRKLSVLLEPTVWGGSQKLMLNTSNHLYLAELYKIRNVNTAWDWVWLVWSTEPQHLSQKEKENTNKEEKGAFKIQMLKIFSCPNSKSKFP